MSPLVVLFLCFAAVAAVPSSPQRIVGGSVTTIQQYPSIAALLYSANLVTYYQACGGTILTTRAVITAAHCSEGDAAKRWRVRVGSSYANSGGVIHMLASILYHPSYNIRTYDSDIAIMRTATAITYGTLVMPASTAGPYYNVADNQAVYAVGWGATSVNGQASEQLRHVQIWSVNQSVCAQRYATLGYTITANMLCSGWLDVGGRDQCQGDSGGPLYHNGVLVGVCSWGEQCALASHPGVNARVSQFSSWIQANA